MQTRRGRALGKCKQAGYSGAARDPVACPPNDDGKHWQACDCTAHVGELGLAMNGQNPVLHDGQPAAEPVVLGPLEYEVSQDVDAR
jgi:hypothetical protein